jgi:hypothetical protein
MKNCFRNVLIALLGSVVIFASCKDEDDVPKSVACDIMSFSVNDTAWAISGTNITHTYPPEMAEGSFAPTITLSSGATISPQASEAQNFFTADGVTYTVTAEDGVTKKTYKAKATRMQHSTVCDIVSFSVDGEEWTFVDDTLITRVYPVGTDETLLLTPTITLLPGTAVNPASGVAQNFFTAEGVRYTVTAEDGVTKKTYTARATRTPYSVCSIESFSVDGEAWTIEGDTLITHVYPSGTTVGQRTPTITLLPGATVSPASGVPQNFFTAEGVTYTVTSEDGSTTKTYVVRARILSAACDIVSFSVGDAAWEIIGDTLITREYPEAVESLTPTIELSAGAIVNPASDVAQNFFTAEGVTYTVTAEDGSTTKTYTARATRALSSACDIIVFEVYDVNGTLWHIGGTDITYAYPMDTPPDATYTPKITLSPGATISPESGVPQNFFTEEGVTYTVTAEDGVTKKTYRVVAVIGDVSSECDITYFDLNGLAWEILGTVLYHVYQPEDAEVGYGPISPTIEVSPGATITPDPGEPQDFFAEEGVTYVVTAEDKVTRKTYNVKAVVEYPPKQGLADRTGWTAVARYGIHDSGDWGVPDRVLDGDIYTGWHTPVYEVAPPPHCIVIDMKESKTITALEIVHNPEALTGDHPSWIYFDQIEVYLSNDYFDPNNDPSSLWPEARYTWPEVGTNPFTIDLYAPASGRYLILYFPNATEQYVSFTELNVYLLEE